MPIPAPPVHDGRLLVNNAHLDLNSAYPTIVICHSTTDRPLCRARRSYACGTATLDDQLPRSAQHVPHLRPVGAGAGRDGLTHEAFHQIRLLEDVGERRRLSKRRDVLMLAQRTLCGLAEASTVRGPWPTVTGGLNGSPAGKLRQWWIQQPLCRNASERDTLRTANWPGRGSVRSRWPSGTCT